MSVCGDSLMEEPPFSKSDVGSNPTPRPRLPDDEFSMDMEYMPTMDSMYHNWLQPRWDKAREEYDKKHEAP